MVGIEFRLCDVRRRQIRERDVSDAVFQVIPRRSRRIQDRIRRRLIAADEKDEVVGIRRNITLVHSIGIIHVTLAFEKRFEANRGED